MEKLEDRIIRLQNDPSGSDRDNLLKQYDSFVLSCVSKVTGRYISSQSDDEYCIGLEAFNDAIDGFDQEKGTFLHFAGLMIRSRVIDYLRKEIRVKNRMTANEEFLLNQPVNVNEDLVEEIRILKELLLDFGIEFMDLVDKSPTHKQVRQELHQLSESLAMDEELMSKVMEKKHLPMKEISLKYTQPLKRVKRFRDYIIATLVVNQQELTLIKSWLNNGGRSNEKSGHHGDER